MNTSRNSRFSDPGGLLKAVVLFTFLLTTVASPLGVQAATLSMHLELDETSGSTADDATANNHDGTINDATLGQSGKIGTAFSFDEVNDYISVADFAFQQNFTVAFWFNVSDNSGIAYQYVYSHGTVGLANSLNIYFDEGSDLLRTYFRDYNDVADSYALDISGAGLVDGEWHHYALTAASGVGSVVYIDGVELNSSSLGGDSYNPSTAIYLARREDGNSERYYGGLLDDVRVYNGALTSNEVYTLANNDEAPPVLSGFNIKSVTHTDAEMASGFAVTGLVYDAGSGITTNSTTPYYFILNSTGTVVVASNLFATTPGIGGGKAAPAPLADTVFSGLSSNQISIGTYTAFVGVIDASVSTNITVSNMTFSVSDDDTAGPALSGFTFANHIYSNNVDIAVTGLVRDAGSGIYAVGTNAPNLSLWNPVGNRLLTNQTFTTAPASNGDATNNEALAYTISQSLFTETGLYTVRVTSVDYDLDRAYDKSAAVMTYTFTVVDTGDIFVHNAGGASNVLVTTARIHGQIFSTGGEDASVRFYWGTSDAGTTKGSWQHEVVLSGTYGAGELVYTNLGGLTSETTYYYRTYATNSVGDDWSDSAASFTTVEDELWQYENILQLFYVPMPENDMHRTLNQIDNGAGNIGSVMNSTISIVPSMDGTLIYYDHWEDGYEEDIVHPRQITTEIWGDNNPITGTPPTWGTNDVVDSACIVNLRDNIDVPRTASSFEFDGGDRFACSRGVSVSRALYAVVPGEVLAGACQVLEAAAFGLKYRAPVGTDTGINDVFELSSFFIMATQDGTLVEVDKNNDGTFETSYLMNKGESKVADFVVAGATVQASKPVQVQFVTGDIGSNYEMRWFTLYPENLWDSDSFTPLGSVLNAMAEVYFFNPNTNSISIKCASLSGTSTVVVAGGEVGTYTMPNYSGAHFFTEDGSVYIPLQTMDDLEGSSGNQAYDWGHDILPRKTLTSMSLIGWGPGAGDPSYNGNPIWATAESNTVIYVDWDADPDTGPYVDPRGNHFDWSNSVQRLEAVAIYDTNDNDQTGARIYTVDYTRLATAWGQDPDTSGTGNPYLDMGSAMWPFPTVIPVKEASLYDDVDANGVVSPGDKIQFRIKVTRAVFDDIVDVVVRDFGMSNATYVANSTTLDGVPVADDSAPPASTVFPLDEEGLNIGHIYVGSTSVVEFLAQVANPFPSNAQDVVNRVVVENREAMVSVPVLTAEPTTISKTSYPTTTVDPGDTISYTVTMENTGTVMQTYVRLIDDEPFSATYVENTARASLQGPFSGTIQDTFQVISYDGNDGNVAWHGDWTEVGESNGADVNYVSVNGDPGHSEQGFVLEISSANLGAYRGADLGSYTGATLRFQYRRDSLESSSEYVSIQASANGGSSFSTLGTIAGAATDGSYSEASYSLNAYLVSNAVIRLLSSGAMSTADRIYFDDITIEVSGNNVTNLALPPPNMIQNYSVAAGSTLTLTYDVTVDNPATAGEIVNIASMTTYQNQKPRKASVTNNVSVNPGMSITKTSSVEGNLDFNQTVVYTIMISNTGDLQQTGVTLVDQLPDWLSYVEGSAWNHTDNEAAEPPPRMLFNKTLDPGESIQVSFTAEVNVAAQIVNRATVTSVMFPDGISSAVTNGVDTLSLTQGMVVVQWDTGACYLAWTAATNSEGQVIKTYDVLRTDSYDFKNTLSNQWLEIQTITNSWLVDTGQVSGVPPRTLNGHMRFYRVAREDTWLNGMRRRFASEEVYVFKNFELYPGQNWVAHPHLPDETTAGFLFGHELPASPTIVGAAKISWFDRSAYPVVTNEIWLYDAGETNMWVYSVPSEVAGQSAENMLVPRAEGYVIEIPEGCGVCVMSTIGLLPTNTVSQVLPANGKISLVSNNQPVRAHPSSMNFLESGLQGGWHPMISDWYWVYSREDQEVPDMIWYDTINQRWRFMSGGFQDVPNGYFHVDEAIVVLTWMTVSQDVTWTNRINYALPTKEMSP
ncbi:MAG: DUF11 domain-containing protein [Verrucomicrobia bacterium]|nr:DUF11 domain-containing protein [Verrucomicrobiota bacterium]